MEKRIRIKIAKGGSFNVETFGFEGETCRHTVENLAQCINGSCEADEERGASFEDPAQYLNLD